MIGIPVLTAEGDCIARAWENSLIALYSRAATSARSTTSRATRPARTPR